MKVGQKVWIQCTEYGRKNEVRESEIRKIGRKYIYTYNMRFHRDTLQEDRGDYNSDHRLWLNKQDFDDNQELKSNFSMLRQRIDSWTPTISLEQSRAMLEILEADAEHVGYTVKDNYGNEDYVDTLVDAERAAKEWLADEDMDWLDYTVEICQRIKIYAREDFNNENTN